MTRSTEQRLEASRRAHEQALDEMVDLFVDVAARLADDAIRDRADVVKDGVKKSTRTRDDALFDHISALVLNRDAHERQRVSENRELLRELCDRVASIEQILRLTPATPVCDRVFGTAASDEGAWDDYDGGVGRP